ncbi:MULTISPECIES: DUF1433 domain-containing protein [Bacillus cereus group]|uniref:DUF1433 domain-containing protein n=1 Tax=Bacillus toyonensis TaxID=155322 RepID=A0AB36SDF9_9BACI|nr:MULTISPECIES: DUF1433 domain-containing protein [Bacillus cereus group]KAB2353994.1 DUF1433 domain-containing protein [Bacillus toyonensis]MBJ7949803.1 DUF1433 domain-containing protein [Bacillus cereus group sp. N24]MBJ8133961.1 DUF1433 domain-containing protein [Bacillus cereus group sp. N3]MCU4970430.1 DUF1433 domain-containing protein [Bacillus toyonensis]OSM10222.1 hypothetical protein BTH38_26780 [Bacillus toyonensis]
MNKKLVIFASIICIIAGGYFTMEYLKQKEKEEQFWKRQEARVEKYIRYNIKDVKSITFTNNEVDPMGVPSVDGYINGNKKLDFSASISTTKDFEDKFSCSGELYDNYVKKPEKSVSEIEKEEKEKK